MDPDQPLEQRTDPHPPRKLARTRPVQPNPQSHRPTHTTRRRLLLLHKPQHSHHRRRTRRPRTPTPPPSTPRTGRHQCPLTNVYGTLRLCADVVAATRGRLRLPRLGTLAP